MNIFERLSNDFNLEREVWNIWNIFSTNKLVEISSETEYYLSLQPKNYTILEYVDADLFCNWKSRGTSVSCEDMMNRLEVKTIISEKKYLKKNYQTRSKP